MAVITPTLTVDPARMAANWGPGVQNNAMKWKQKTLAPKKMFNANAAQSQATLLQKVQAALAANRYVNAMGKVDLQAMATAIDTYGEQNYSNAGINKAARYANKTTAVAGAINAALAAVAAIPRGTDANNDNRALTFSRVMRTYKGKI
jgi:hypothetical protein